MAETKRRILVKLQYRGGAYLGWAIQPHGPSIQGAIQSALVRIIGTSPYVATPSRTDAGVHAKGQLASFDIEHPTSLKRLFLGLNAVLPDDIAVVDMVEVPLENKVPKGIGKRYQYQIWWGPYFEPFLRETHWWIKKPLELAPMIEGAKLYLGTHDFKAFQASGCEAKTTVKTITMFDVSEGQRGGGRRITLTVEGNGFLRHQIRIMAGTLADLGQHKLSLEGLKTAINQGKRADSGQTAPPQGLTLEKIFRQPDPFETRGIDAWDA